MLFTDSDFIALSDLAAVDPEVSKLGTAEGIITEGSSNSVCARACDEVGQKLIDASQAVSGYAPPYLMPYTQTAAVLNGVTPSVNRSRIVLSEVVVSGPQPGYTESLKLYAIHFGMYLFYRSAFRRKLDDRLEKKMNLYAAECRKVYWPRVVSKGIPIVYKPMACPGAIHEPNTGTWDGTRLSQVSGTNSNSAMNYDVAITWVDSSLYTSQASKGNGESAPSARASINITTNNVLKVDITPLNPPNGTNPLTIPLGQGLIVPGNATGWNVYVGQSGSTLYLQNSSPIAIATKTYTLSGAPTLSGNGADTGQYAQAYWSIQEHTTMRG